MCIIKLDLTVFWTDWNEHENGAQTNSEGICLEISKNAEFIKIF